MEAYTCMKIKRQRCCVFCSSLVRVLSFCIDIDGKPVMDQEDYLRVAEHSNYGTRFLTDLQLINQISILIYAQLYYSSFNSHCISGCIKTNVAIES